MLSLHMGQVQCSLSQGSTQDLWNTCLWKTDSCVRNGTPDSGEVETPRNRVNQEPTENLLKLDSCSHEAAPGEGRSSVRLLGLFMPPNSKNDVRKLRKFVKNEDNELHLRNQLWFL